MLRVFLDTDTLSEVKKGHADIYPNFISSFQPWWRP